MRRRLAAFLASRLVETLDEEVQEKFWKLGSGEPWWGPTCHIDPDSGRSSPSRPCPSRPCGPHETFITIPLRQPDKHPSICLSPTGCICRRSAHAQESDSDAMPRIGHGIVSCYFGSFQRSSGVNHMRAQKCHQEAHLQDTCKQLRLFVTGRRRRVSGSATFSPIAGRSLNSDKSGP